MNASRIRVRAERELGQAAEGHGGEWTAGDAIKWSRTRSVAWCYTYTRGYLGIPRDRASRAMQLADVPEDQFEAAFACELNGNWERD
jgi:hypothetical protein